MQKTRENHETIQNLTSQLQEMQEQMNSMSLKELIHSGAPQREQGSVPQATGKGTLFARDDKQNRGTIPMPTSAGRPSTMSSTIPVDFPQNSMVGQQRQQISELQFNKFPNSQSFLVKKIRFKNQVTAWSDFPSEAMYGSKKWRWLTHWKH